MFNLRQSPQQLIDKLYQERMPDGIYKNITNRKVKSDYNKSDSDRYILELLQNASDTKKPGSKEGVIVNFDIFQNYIIFSHNGLPFIETDVVNICDYSQYDSEKSNDTSKIGYKGTGFKSVFKISNWVYIRSGGYSFRFDEQELTRNLPNYPWELIPIWTNTEELPNFPNSLQNRINDNETVFIIKINPNIKVVEDQLKQLLNNLEIMLFITNIDKINISYNGHTIKQELKKEKSDYKAFTEQKMYRDGKLQERWITRNFEIPMTSQMRSYLPTEDSECPKRLHEAVSISFDLAAKINTHSNEIIPSAGGKFYCFFPTEFNTELPVCVNTQFLLKDDRTQLPDNAWNRKLIELIPEKIFHWMSELASSNDYQAQVLQLFPSENLDRHSKFNSAYRAGYNNWLKKIAFIPTHSNTLEQLDNVCIDETDFYYTFPKCQDSKLKLVKKDLANLTRLKEALSNKQIINVAELASRLPTLIKKQQENGLNTCNTLHALHKKQHENGLIICKYLTFVAKKFEYQSHHFQDIKFIYTVSDELCSSRDDLFFPPSNLPINLQPDEIKKIVALKPFFEHKIDITPYENFLSSLGVKKIDEAEAISLIGKYLESQQPGGNEQLLTVTKFIFDHRDKIKYSDWPKLARLEVIIKSATNPAKNIPAYQAWLSAEYSPELAIESLFPGKEIFIHPDYITHQYKLHEDPKEVTAFFKKLGVADTINIHELPSIKLSELPPLFAEFGTRYQQYIVSNYPNIALETTSIKPFIYTRYEALELAYKYPEGLERLLKAIDQNIYRLTNANANTLQLTSDTSKLDLDILQFFFKTYKLPLLNNQYIHEHYHVDGYNELLASVPFNKPVLNFNLRANTLNYLNVHTEITVEECIDFLNLLNQVDNFAAVSDKYCQLYKLMLSFNQTKFNTLKYQLRQWKGYLPSQNNQLILKEKLNGFAIDSLEIGNTNTWFKTYEGQLNKGELCRLYELFNINRITASQAKFDILAATEDDVLRNLLSDSLQYVAAVEAFITGHRGIDLREGYQKKLSELKFKTVKEIKISRLESDDDVLQTEEFHQAERTLYLKFGLNPLNFERFFEFITSYFSLHNSQTKEVLRMALSYRDHTHMVNYLAQRNYTIAQLEQAMVSGTSDRDNTISSNATSITPSPSTTNLASSISRLADPSAQDIDLNNITYTKLRPTSTQSQSQPQALAICLTSPSNVNTNRANHTYTTNNCYRTVDIGRWGEELVYRWFVNQYSKKIDIELASENAGCWEAEGRYKYKNIGVNIAISWNNYAGEKGLSYDLKVTKQKYNLHNPQTKSTEERIIEVKTTISGSNPAYITINEIAEMKQQGNRYRIFRVAGAYTSTPSVTKYVNPAQMIENNEIAVSSIQLKI